MLREIKKLLPSKKVIRFFILFLFIISILLVDYTFFSKVNYPIATLLLIFTLVVFYWLRQPLWVSSILFLMIPLTIITRFIYF